MRFLAALQGVDLDKEAKKKKGTGWFKDPSVYENMSEPEKQAETEKMMARLGIGLKQTMGTKKR